MLKIFGRNRKRDTAFIPEEQWMDASIKAAIIEKQVRQQLNLSAEETRRRAREAFDRADAIGIDAAPHH